MHHASKHDATINEVKKASKGRPAKDKSAEVKRAKKQQEELIDEAGADSFPASDPPSWTETKAA